MHMSVFKQNHSGPAAMRPIDHGCYHGYRCTEYIFTRKASPSSDFTSGMTLNEIRKAGYEMCKSPILNENLHPLWRPYQ